MQLNGLVQDWPKWLFRANFLSFKSTWIFACTFQFRSETFSCIFWAEMLLFALLRSLCMLQCFVLVFSETKCKAAKKIQGDVLLRNWKHMEKGKKVHLKSHLGQSCTQPFNCSNSNIQLLTNQMVSWQPKEPFRAPVCFTTYCASLNLWCTREV